MQSGDLDCAPSDMVISYVMHSREKVNPTIINTDVCVLTYIMDADIDGFRPILRINMVERFFEGPLNSSAPPPLRSAVDDDLIDGDLNYYENDTDDKINMKDYSIHMEDFSSDSQDDEEDRETESQAGHSFTDGTNFCCGQTLADKKELKMQLDAAVMRQFFDYYMEKSYTKLMKTQCLSRGCCWLLREKSTIPRTDFAYTRYAHMRNVITVDGTHLYGKYGGILLSAVAQDTENYIFLIAFCVVDKESDASWTFFFQKLKSIIEDEPDLCVISDRHISIANDFFRVYSRAHHGLCMRRLTKNLCVNQHCGEHLYLFYVVSKASSFDEFSDNFVKLNSKCPEAAHVLENVRSFKKWSRAHFSGNRYDVMTTNIAESLNSILIDEREYPVLYIFNSIAKKFGEKFRKRNDVTAKVNLLERSCSCRKFDLVKMPCEHAIATLQEKYGDGEDYGNSIYDYSSPIYKDESYLLAYSEVINVVPLEAEWTVPQELVDTKISPPPYDPKLGRKKVKCTKGIGETFKSKRRNRYSICKKSGHKRTTCRMGIKS
ncbi:hypothetical protein P3L10_005550 [Capsicum annuum]